jgi:DNA-directed RNA polymerase subunit RPC12/RpoP
MGEYLYRCVKCKKVVPIEKPLAKVGQQERCPFCHLPMIRLYTPPIILGETSVKEQNNER